MAGFGLASVGMLFAQGPESSNCGQSGCASRRQWELDLLDIASLQMPDTRDPRTPFRAAKRRFAVKGRGSSGLREKRGRSRIGGWSDGCCETRAGCCYRRWDRDWSDSCYETRAGCCCGCWDKDRLGGWDSPSCPGDRENPDNAGIRIQRPETRTLGTRRTWTHP